jgi:hypothetical protein
MSLPRNYYKILWAVQHPYLLSTDFDYVVNVSQMSLRYYPDIVIPLA